MRDVAHVERHDHRQAQPPGFQHEPQVQLEVAGVGHADQQRRRVHVGARAGDHVARDRLVGAERVQAVGARQVEDAHAPVRSPCEAGPRLRSTVTPA